MVSSPMTALRLVVWNCRSGFAEKHSALVDLRPDLAIVPEASEASLATLAKQPPRPSTTGFIGPNPRRGLAVLSYGPYSVEPLPRAATDLPDALALKVRGPRPFTLLAVWTRGPRYIRNLHAVLDACGPRLTGDVVVAGDFNSNTIWDRLHGERCHSAMVRRLEAEYGLVSAYHAVRGETQGQETTPTFHMYLKDRPAYHIDYCFIPRRWSSAVQTVEVVSGVPWRRLSDHVPLVVTVGSDTDSSNPGPSVRREPKERRAPSMKEHPLKEALQRAGMTQTELAKSATVPQPQVSQVISGRRDRFGPDAAHRIVTALAARGVELALDVLIFPWEAPPKAEGPEDATEGVAPSRIGGPN